MAGVRAVRFLYINLEKYFSSDFVNLLRWQTSKASFWSRKENEPIEETSLSQTEQGFRFSDAGDWLSRDLMLKRGVDFTSGLNSVPMMGKREDELFMESDNQNEEDI